MNPIAIVFTIIGVMVVLFVSNRVPVGLAALGATLALYGTGVLDLGQALGGFGDPVVLFIASLMVVSASLDATGVAAWAGAVLAGWAGNDHARLLVLSMLVAAALTAFIGPGGAVAALMPVVVLVAVRIGISPSRLLMPMVVAAQAGSMLVLTGSFVNLIASEEAMAVGLPGFGYFEITRIGIPVLAGTLAIVALFGRRLVPVRSSRLIPGDLSGHPGRLAAQYHLFDDLVSLEVTPDSSIAGAWPSAIGLRNHPELSLIAVHSSSTHAHSTVLAPGDLLLVRGDAEAIQRFAEERGLVASRKPKDADLQRSLFNVGAGYAEVLIPPRSGLIGEKMFPGMVTPSGDLIVLAIQRRGETLGPGETVLAAGDTLLLRGSWKALDERLADLDVITVDKPELVRRQAVPMGIGAGRASVIVAAMVLLLATGVIPAPVAALLAAGAVVLSGVMTMEQAHRAINWSAIIMVGSLIPLSTAIYRTGAANLLADWLVHLAGNASPTVLIAGIFLLTAVLSQMISSAATALIVMPVAISAAQGIGISVRPALVTVVIAAACSFLTPISSTANMMVQGPGGYRFGDYWKLGLPLLALYFAVALALVPLFWPFFPSLPR
ncbi:MAG: SLC13 family permease [Acetobacteraceae bacterium]